MNPPGPKSRRALVILSLAAAALAAGIGGALWSGRRPAPPAAPAPTPWALATPLAVPPPTDDLRAAQAAALGGDQDALARLEQQMRGYRASWQGLPPEVAAKHAEADRLMDAGQDVEAARQVASIVETAPTAPGDAGALADSRRVLIQDAYFRLCRMALAAGQAIVTSVQTHQALALGEPDDVFVTNLLLVRAAASDRTGETAQAQGDRQRLQALFK